MVGASVPLARRGRNLSSTLQLQLQTTTHPPTALQLQLQTTTPPPTTLQLQLQTTTHPPHNYKLAALVALALAALAGALYFVLGRAGAPRPPQKNAPHRSTTTTTNYNYKHSASTNRVAAAGKSAATKVEEKKAPDKWLGVEVKSRTVTTNGYSVVERIYTVDGKKHYFFRDIAPQTFEHASDQILALLTSDNNGAMPPPLPGLGPGFENEFAKSLKTEIVINEDDSDRVKEVKERVKRARAEMLEHMAEGMSAQQVIDEHRAMVKNNAELREEAVKGLREYLDAGDEEGAKDYCEKVSAALEQMGVMGIEVPRSRTVEMAERKNNGIEEDNDDVQQENTNE